MKQPLVYFTANIRERKRKDFQTEQTFPTMSGKRLAEYFFSQTLATNTQMGVRFNVTIPFTALAF